MSEITKNGTVLGKIIENIFKAQIESMNVAASIYFKLQQGKRPHPAELARLTMLSCTSHKLILELREA